MTLKPICGDPHIYLLGILIMNGGKENLERSILGQLDLSTCSQTEDIYAHFGLT